MKNILFVLVISKITKNEVVIYVKAATDSN